MNSLADINKAIQSFSIEELKELMVAMEQRVLERQQPQQGNPRIPELLEGQGRMTADFDLP